MGDTSLPGAHRAAVWTELLPSSDRAATRQVDIYGYHENRRENPEMRGKHMSMAILGT